MLDKAIDVSQVEIKRRIAIVRRILETCERPHGYIELKRRKILPQLERALKKIENGSYGYCADCGEAIPLARLEKVPGATRCANCQTHFETTA